MTGAVPLRDGRAKAKRRVCPRPGCGRVWYALAADEGDLCPACRSGHAPLAVVGSSRVKPQAVKA